MRDTILTLFSFTCEACSLSCRALKKKQLVFILSMNSYDPVLVYRLSQKGLHYLLGVSPNIFYFKTGLLFCVLNKKLQTMMLVAPFVVCLTQTLAKRI